MMRFTIIIPRSCRLYADHDCNHKYMIYSLVKNILWKKQHSSWIATLCGVFMSPYSVMKYWIIVLPGGRQCPFQQLVISCAWCLRLLIINSISWRHLAATWCQQQMFRYFGERCTTTFFLQGMTMVDVYSEFIQVTLCLADDVEG